MRHFTAKDCFYVCRFAFAGCLYYECACAVGEREIGFVAGREHVGDLGGGKFCGLTFPTDQADAAGGQSFERSIIVKSADGRIPDESVNVEKVVLEQLLDGMWFSSGCHIGVIFDAPKIENHSLGTKPALRAAEGIRSLVGLA